MTTDAITLSSEEIADLRLKFADHQQALASLDVIEECEGHLEDAVTLIKMRKTGIEPDRSVNLLDLVNKYRSVICKDEAQDILDLFGLLSPLVDPSLGLPLGLFVFKIGVKQFCKQNT
ncbi:hypothetical protein [Cylindrospermum sp. FACHB-282]|uniref:hypothetical protein n=1 Tax=Cylindrospermum sp. FACHB-282 TaxID=2692794 RepID=UPI001686B33F|nr:hypothetical protein [Cylindrospermum sp. FACHB-282]MBD2384061.1 hypothetical protein [Cylindrospermum sp. FACHB-282]